MQPIEQLRIEAAKAGLYAIEESQNKWLCLKKSGAGYLARGEQSEAMALRAGLREAKVQQRQIDM